MDRDEHDTVSGTERPVPAHLASARPGRRRWRALLGGAALVTAIVMALVLAGDDGDDVGTVAPTTGGDETTAAEDEDTTTTPTAARSASAVVVSLDGILGWWDGEAWVQAEPGAAPPVTGGERYQVVQVGRATAEATGSAPRAGCPIGDGSTTVELGLEAPAERGPRPIAVTGVDVPAPRPVELLRPDQYGPAATEALAGLGIDDPDPAIVQVVRSDLLGDGTDEVLLVVERLGPDAPYPEEGDYSVLLLRQVVEGEVRTTVLHEAQAEVDPDGTVSPFLETVRIDALADLNDDGAMEIATSTTYYEGAATTVYESDAEDEPTEVLSLGCGA